jgi:hypothetical protein
MAMDRVVIGVDPHKLSVTIEARDSREILRAAGQFGTDSRSYRQLLDVARQWPERIWAVEGANGIGCPLAQRLLASGERVLDVPAKLAARARVFGTGQGRKTDATNAHAPPGSSPASGTSPGSPTATTSRPGPAPPRSTPPAASICGTGCPAPGTAA